MRKAIGSETKHDLDPLKGKTPRRRKRVKKCRLQVCTLFSLIRFDNGKSLSADKSFLFHLSNCCDERKKRFLIFVKEKSRSNQGNKRKGWV